MTRLTIAIPTYNRPRQLTATISRLLPQLSSEVEIVVLDNHSPEPLEAVLAPLSQQFPNARLQIIRHPANIGGNANILRCLEVGSGEWIWTLGDDDEPSADAVKKILAGITQHEQAVCINFATSIKPRTETFTADSTSLLVGQLDSFSNLLFITANVYNRKRTHPYLQVALAYLHSCAAQVVIFLAAVLDSQTVIFSQHYIARNIPLPYGWPTYYSFYFYNIIECLPDIKSRRKIAILITDMVGPLNIWWCLRWAFASQVGNPKAPSALLFLARGSRLRAYYEPSVTARWRMYIISWGAERLLNNQPLALAAWKKLHQFKHKKTLEIPNLIDAYNGHFPQRKKLTSVSEHHQQTGTTANSASN